MHDETPQPLSRVAVLEQANETIKKEMYELRNEMKLLQNNVANLLSSDKKETVDLIKIEDIDNMSKPKSYKKAPPEKKTFYICFKNIAKINYSASGKDWTITVCQENGMRIIKEISHFIYKVRAENEMAAYILFLGHAASEMTDNPYYESSEVDKQRRELDDEDEDEDDFDDDDEE